MNLLGYRQPVLGTYGSIDSPIVTQQLKKQVGCRLGMK